MPPKKKAKTGEKRILKEFLLILGTLSNLYEKKGDHGRAKSFSGAVKSLGSFARPFSIENPTLELIFE